MRGVLVSLPARFAHAIKKPKGLKWEYQIARLCENSDSVILKNEKAVRITFTENKNAP
jgi:hypothetical protein